MPSRVLYQIPLATWPVQWVMGAACLLFVLTICGWWLPRSIRRVRILIGESKARAAVGAAFALIPVAIGVGPLFLAIALIINPQAYVTDRGVIKENVFDRTPVSFAWEEIARVNCRSESPGTISSIIIAAKDGRKLELGNTGGVDFISMYELFENQLGPIIVSYCEGAPRSSR